ncbi:MAG: hypothetical protein H0T13_02390, partial [Actinobacteria bacterium]|nr:hypothetical protein [Actinomycetota bacterium]
MGLRRGRRARGGAGAARGVAGAPRERRRRGRRQGGRRRPAAGDGGRAADVRRRRDRHLDASGGTLELAGAERRRRCPRAVRRSHHSRRRRSRKRLIDGIFLARPERPGDGITLAVKDLFDTAGLETTYGSAIFAGHVPRETASAVAALEAAGYANVGKTNLHEFAYGTTSENPHFG